MRLFVQTLSNVRTTHPVINDQRHKASRFAMQFKQREEWPMYSLGKSF